MMFKGMKRCFVFTEGDAYTTHVAQ